MMFVKKNEMLKNLFSFFSAARIHSSKRKDRADLFVTWEAIYDVKVQNIEALIHTDGRKGCALSHQLVANTLEPPYIVLEDDAIPTTACFTDVEALRDLQNIKDFDILYLGGMPAFGHRPSAFPSIRKGKAWTTHALIVFPQGAKWFQDFSFEGTPIDVALARSNLRQGFLKQEWFVQASSISDVNQSAFTKSVFFTENLNVFRSVWRLVVLHQYLALLFFFLFIFLR